MTRAFKGDNRILDFLSKDITMNLEIIVYLDINYDLNLLETSSFKQKYYFVNVLNYKFIKYNLIFQT